MRKYGFLITLLLSNFGYSATISQTPQWSGRYDCKMKFETNSYILGLETSSWDKKIQIELTPIKEGIELREVGKNQFLKYTSWHNTSIFPCENGYKRLNPNGVYTYNSSTHRETPIPDSEGPTFTAGICDSNKMILSDINKDYVNYTGGDYSFFSFQSQPGSEKLKISLVSYVSAPNASSRDKSEKVDMVCRPSSSILPAFTLGWGSSETVSANPPKNGFAFSNFVHSIYDREIETVGNSPIVCDKPYDGSLKNTEYTCLQLISGYSYSKDYFTAYNLYHLKSSPGVASFLRPRDQDAILDHSSGMKSGGYIRLVRVNSDGKGELDFIERGWHLTAAMMPEYVNKEALFHSQYINGMQYINLVNMVASARFTKLPLFVVSNDSSGTIDIEVSSMNTITIPLAK